MKIGFDCSALLGDVTGIGRYSYNLLRGLVKTDKENTYTPYLLYALTNYILHPGLKARLPKEANAKAIYRHIPIPYQAFSYLFFPGMPACFREYMLGNMDADIVHSTTFCVPRFKDAKKRLVVTIYDLTVITHPECHKKLNIRHCKKGIEDAVKYADAIVAISEHTKKDLIEIAGAPEELVTVTPLAPDPDLKPITDKKTLEKVRNKYKLPENYILFLGSLEPRKNVTTLIKAYAGLPESYKKKNRLVIAGAKGWMSGPVHDTLDKLGLLDKTTFTGYVEREDLAALYSMAMCFVYPSLYEGFGLPVLEAMACGAPVVTSNTSSMPEVAGNAARLIDPLNEAELTLKLEEILGSKDVQEEMRQEGFIQAEKFSWERCAAETLEVYKKVYENPKRVNP